jgi:hypothetical protein
MLPTKFQFIQFQRRRLKCGKLMDDGGQVMAKAKKPNKIWFSSIMTIPIHFNFDKLLFNARLAVRQL